MQAIDTIIAFCIVLMLVGFVLGVLSKPEQT